jgi:hypothetical protein
LEEAIADGKLPQYHYCYKIHWKIKVQKLQKF